MTIQTITSTEGRRVRTTWSLITEPGDKNAAYLISRLGHTAALAAITTGPRRALDDYGSGMRRRAEEWRGRLGSIDTDATLALAAAHGIQLIDPASVPALADLGATPHVLWVRGDAAALAASPAITVSGARAATAYGEHVTAEIVGDLVREGVGIHSGAGYGIDAAAHRAALARGGRTVAWMAGGVDRAYPAGHSELLEALAHTRGCAIVSEVAPGQAPTKWRLMQRRRVMTAATAATIIIEAGWRSGSVGTGIAAADLGRELGAVPGPITSAASAGCHRLMQEHGASVITSGADALALLSTE